jgi:hypothetical protein
MRWTRDMNESMSKKGLLDKISRFFNPGYVITLSVCDVDKTVLDKITDTLKAKGFILVQENSHPVRRGYLLASYLKSFSSERNAVSGVSGVYRGSLLCP